MIIDYSDKTPRPLEALGSSAEETDRYLQDLAAEIVHSPRNGPTEATEVVLVGKDHDDTVDALRYEPYANDYALATVAEAGMFIRWTIIIVFWIFTILAIIYAAWKVNQ